MKQKDILVIVVIAIIAGGISFFVSSALFVGGGSKQEAETVDAIGTTFTPPSNRYFNSSAINPTQTIEIGDSENPTPFKDTN